MSTKVTLYQNLSFTKDDNFMLLGGVLKNRLGYRKNTDLWIDSYLSTLEAPKAYTLTHDLFYGNKSVFPLSYTIVLTDTDLITSSKWNNNSARYCTIQTTGNVKAYYFVDRVEYVSNNSWRFYLSLDTLNSFGDYIVKNSAPNSHITRRHKDRYFKSAEPDWYNVIIDRTSEDFNPTKYITQNSDIEAWNNLPAEAFAYISYVSAPKDAIPVKTCLNIYDEGATEYKFRDYSQVGVYNQLKKLDPVKVGTHSEVVGLVYLPYLPFADFPTISGVVRTYDAEGFNGYTYPTEDTYISNVQSQNHPSLVSPFVNTLQGKLLPFTWSIHKTGVLPHEPIQTDPKYYHSGTYDIIFKYGSNELFIKPENIIFNSDSWENAGLVPKFYFNNDFKNSAMFVIEPDTIDYAMTSQDDLTLFVDDLGALPQMKNEYIDWTRYEKRFEEASYNANKYQNALMQGWESLKNLTEDPIGTIINNSDFAVRQLQTEINREQRNVLRQANPTTIQANGSMSLNWSIYGNKLKFIVREPRNEIKQAINNIYYRYGYTTDEYTSLTDNIINSRRYFNYIKGDINIATAVSLEKDRYISQDAITDVLERFKSGVTILHTLSDLTSTANVIDVDCFKFEYENWEDFIAYGGLF